MTDFTVKFNYVMEVHKNLVRDNRCIAGIRDENLLISAIEGQYWYDANHTKSREPCLYMGSRLYFLYLTYARPKCEAEKDTSSSWALENFRRARRLCKRRREAIHTSMRASRLQNNAAMRKFNMPISLVHQTGRALLLPPPRLLFQYAGCVCLSWR